MAVEARNMRFRVHNHSNKSDDGPKDQLLVFGYSCKLFRDDGKAKNIDKGTHLIPWMGDKSLMIDRFDARGYLHDLQPFEHSSNSELELSHEEKHIEALCEEERYMALHKDLDEEAVHHEEELKRLRAALTDDSTYKEVQFNYDTAVEKVEPVEPVKLVKEENGTQAECEVPDPNDDKPFIVPIQLNLPSNIFAPRTVKENAIIEKTAAFIADHGTQMEIVLKTKQSTNTQFQFLSFDSPLNPYYKYLVDSIKEGRYKPNIESQNSDEEDDDDDDSYLHPSLLAGNSSNSSQSNLMRYYTYNSQNDDSAYSQLVDKLKDKVVHYSINETSQPSSQCQSPVNVSPKHETPEPSQSFVIPPEEMQQVIDKMAAYVAKNGESFEKTVLGKGDSRFDFLQSSHKYNTYYKQRCKHHMLEARPSPKVLNHEKKIKKAVKAPVSFAIKSKDGDGTTLEKNVLSGDESDAVEEDNSQNTNQLADPADAPNSSALPSSQTECEKPTVEPKQVQPQERLKDKIAAAARERMAQITKEKMLQLERRRKAVLFLNMIKDSGLDIESAKNPAPSTTDDNPKHEDSLLLTSAITSPSNSPQPSPQRSKDDKEEKIKEIANIHSNTESTFRSSSKSSSSSKRSESRSRPSSKKHKRSRSRSNSRSSSHRHRSSREKSSKRSHLKSRKRSKRSRSPAESKRSKSSRRRNYSSSDSS